MTFCRGPVRGLGIASLVLATIFLVAAFVPLTAPSAHAQTITVSSIVVQGNQRVEANTIRSYFRPGPSGRLDAFSIDEGVKALYATGLFQDIRTVIQGGRLILTVVENPVINRIAFEGNKKVKDEQLKAEIQSKERGTLSRPVVQADVARLVEVYRRSGRFDIHIEPKIIELPNNRVDLVFEITEGPKTGVKTIEFVGNRAYSSYRLKDVIKTSETGILAFLQTGDIYDPDRLEADRELLRRFYLKHGFVDVRVVSAMGEYDPARRGFVIVFTIEEGEQFRVGTVDVQSNIRPLDPGLVRSRLRVSAGDIYNAEAVEKSVEDMTIEAAKHGFAFASVRPRATRDAERRLINLVFVVEEGQRAYIERINVRGNTRTRDYVIRREFDIAEGDAYNRALVNRAERRLKNLGYFKTVKIGTEPGSAPDRVILNGDVEEQSTGEFSVSGGFSTADGFLAEVSIAERNLLGRGYYGKASVQYGQYTRGGSVSFVDPYLYGYRVALGIDLFVKEQLATSYVSYQTKTYGGGFRLGFALREDLGLQLRYSIYRQEVSLPSNLTNCNNVNPDGISTFPTPDQQLRFPLIPYNCYFDGEASLAVKRELANGPVITSLVGYSLSYNTLDNNKSPTSGLLAELRQDFAGVGGDVNFVRTTGDVYSYREVMPDIVGFVHLQGGFITGWGGKDLRMLDHFQMGPGLVRGFAPAGIGPRDLTQYPFTGLLGDALGGTMYWGSSLEFQTPLYFLPKDAGVKVAAFADAGSLWNFTGPTSFGSIPAGIPPGLVLSGNICPTWGPLVPNGGVPCPVDNAMHIRSSVGLGLIWDSPFGPLRFDYSFPLTKEPYDRVQQFRFGGGTKF
jgi:outer membrane protein insertion porin family